MNDFKIIFIHGYTASHVADWYPNISKELDKFGVDYVVPDLPGETRPHAKDWLEVLHKVISQINKPLVLVGHSLGTRTALLSLGVLQRVLLTKESSNPIALFYLLFFATIPLT